MRSRLLTLGLTLCLVAACPDSALGQNSDQPSNTKSEEEAKDAAELDLDQLANMDVKVTSASKKSENLSTAPAAIYVLSGDAIRRGGFSSVPDALRSVPGLYVAQQDSHPWVVVARGFGTAFNTKMLVLLDGRLLYQPLYGGVYWDSIDPPLEDIDRIEIIRGPGGALWGANALNGVINIITKNSRQTQGGLVATSAGINDRYKAGMRYGGTLGRNFSYRLFGQALYGDPTVDSAGIPQRNSWNFNQGGIRADWTISDTDNFSFEGQGYRGGIETRSIPFSDPSAPGPDPIRDMVMQGGNILGRWTHNISDRSATDVLAYCDWFDRFDIQDGDVRNTCNIEVQHNFTFTPRNSIIWGGSFLTTGDTPPHIFEASYTPPQLRTYTYTAFGQYELSLVPGKLRLVSGVKLEHNSFTGFEVEPQFRVVWTPEKSSTLWGSVSRAVRTPSQFNIGTDLKITQVPGGRVPVFLSIVGNPNLESEVLLAYELGYRRQLSASLSIDIAAFYNNYDRLIVFSAPGAPRFFPSYIELPLPFVNGGGGQTHGLELSAEWRPVRRWSLTTAITETRGVSVAGGNAGDNNPRHIATLQSRFDLASHFEFDSSYYYYDAIPGVGIPTLNRVDVGFSTRRISGFTFAVWGQNLQSEHHLEKNGNPPGYPAADIRRAVVLKLMWQSSR